MFSSITIIISLPDILVKQNTGISSLWILLAQPLYWCTTILQVLCVVATTRQNSTCDMLTSAKLSVGYLVMEITRKLDKKPLLHYFSIYINTIWFMLQQYLPALMSMYHPHVLLLIHHKATMPYTCALTSYFESLSYMCAPCVHYEEPLSLDITPNSNSYLDSSRSF